MPILSTDTLLAGAEVWLPSGGTLERRGHFGSANVEESLVAEFIAGVNSVGVPQVESLASDETTASMGIPVYRGDTLTGIVCLHVDADKQRRGALECWMKDETRFELSLRDAFYAHAPRFERISQLIKIPFRSGLPGGAWSMQAPRLIKSLGQSLDFLRGGLARSEDLDVGLGIPVIRACGPVAVALLISSQQSPLARLWEIWVPKQDASGAKRVQSVACCDPDADETQQECEPAIGEAVSDAVLEQLAPVIVSDLPASEMTPPVEQALGIPCFLGDGQLRAIVVLAF